MSKQDINVVKGIAICFVILAHLTIYLEDIGGGSNAVLKPFTVMGGMGVLLFFFLSGYGLYKGYATKKIVVEFWKKRILNMYLPSVVIQTIFCLIWSMNGQNYDIKNLILNSLFGAWFIDVMLIQYFLFFITGLLIKEKPQKWIALNFLVSMIIAFIFWKQGFNARWYNGLMLFPFGMLIAYAEKRIIVWIEKNGASCIIQI